LTIERQSRMLAKVNGINDDTHGNGHVEESRE
jgi:hypothetical protein